jgi:hypothetical protein
MKVFKSIGITAEEHKALAAQKVADLKEPNKESSTDKVDDDSLIIDKQLVTVIGGVVPLRVIHAHRLDNRVRVKV